MTDPGGMVTLTGDTYLRPSGERYLRVTKQPAAYIENNEIFAAGCGSDGRDSLLLPHDRRHSQL